MKLLLMTFAIGLLTMVMPQTLLASSCAAPSTSTTVDLPAAPFQAIASPDDCWLFVSMAISENHGAVAVLHNQGGTFKLDHHVELRGAGYGEALTHDGALLIVTTDNGIAVLDVGKLERNDSDALLGTFSSDAHSGSVYAAVSLDDRRLFVSEEYARNISVWDLDKARQKEFGAGALIGHIPTATAPVGLALSPDGHWLFATSEAMPPAMHMSTDCKAEGPNGHPHAQGLLLRIDTDKALSDPVHAVAAATPAGCNPVRVALSPSGKTAWITARGDDALLRLQTDELQAGTHNIHVSKFPIGPSPIGVAIRPDGAQVWVAISDRFSKGGGGRLAGFTNIDSSTPTSVLSAPAPGFPREVTFLRDGHTLIATLFTAKQVMLVPTSN
jgi:DNA-binding beta-propeller fold protein YncE